MDEMEENQLLINRTGTWIKTRSERVESWMETITTTLKTHGYRLWKSTTTTTTSIGRRSLSFYHLSHDSLNVNFYEDGHINFSAKNVRNLYSTLLPHLEKKLRVEFRCISSDGGTSYERHWEFGYRKYLDDYLRSRVRSLDLPVSVLKKCGEKDNVNYVGMVEDGEGEVSTEDGLMGNLTSHNNNNKENRFHAF